MKIVLPLLLLSLAAAGPALAQEETPFTDAVLTTAGACFAAPADATFPMVVSLCTKADDEMAKLLREKTDTTASEASVFHSMYATVLSTLGGAQAQVDRARSARSCQTQERAWVSATLINPATSATHGDDMRQVKSDIARVISICRKDFPAAPGAPSLP